MTNVLCFCVLCFVLSGPRGVFLFSFCDLSALCGCVVARECVRAACLSSEGEGRLGRVGRVGMIGRGEVCVCVCGGGGGGGCGGGGGGGGGRGTSSKSLSHRRCCGCC